MLLDINSGESKTYNISLKTNTISKPVVDSPILDEYFIESGVIKLDNRLSLFGDEVTAQLLKKTSEVDKSMPDYTDQYYLQKVGSIFKYTKDKPFLYQRLGRNVSIKDIDQNLLQKGVRSLLYSSWESTTEVWMKFSLPYGGISKGSLLLGYVGYGGEIKELVLNEKVEVDFLEGVVYIRQDYEEEVKQILAYFDIEPLSTTSTGYLSPLLTSGGLFGSYNQRDGDGDVEITRNGSDVILSISYDCFIVPSDPYLIEVDGINLLERRYVPAYQPILIRQVFNTEVENFLNTPTLKTGSSYGSPYTSITYNSTINANIFDINQIAAGLFLYRANGSSSFDDTRSAYIPLFSKQTIIQ